MGSVDGKLTPAVLRRPIRINQGLHPTPYNRLFHDAPFVFAVVEYQTSRISACAGYITNRNLPADN